MQSALRSIYKLLTIISPMMNGSDFALSNTYQKLMQVEVTPREILFSRLLGEKNYEFMISDHKRYDVRSDIMSCYDDKNCTTLDLSNCGIQRLPRELFTYLSHLKKLDLSENHLTELPTMRSLTELQYFDCSQNKLKSIETVRACQQLETLFCYSNVLENSFPNLSYCSKLQRVNCSWNQLYSIWGLYDCQALEVIYCHHNKLAVLPDFKGFCKLREVNCHANRLTVLPDFADCTQFEHLSCSCNQLVSLSGLRSCRNLQIVHCSDNQIESLLDLSECIALRQIYCSRNKICGFLDPQQHPELEAFDCSENPLKESLPAFIGCKVESNGVGHKLRPDLTNDSGVIHKMRNLGGLTYLFSRRNAISRLFEEC